MSGVCVSYRTRGVVDGMRFDKEARVTGLTAVDPVNLKRLLEAVRDVVEPDLEDEP